LCTYTFDVSSGKLHEDIKKGYVRNKARLEGSMAKGYTIENALKFCTKYLQDFITTNRKVWDDQED
jgi:hypothetical protein